MRGYSPQLPMSTTDEDGHYALNKSIKDVVLQNLRVLFLTSKGERFPDCNFGIGLKRYLFSQDTIETQAELRSIIVNQVSRYMPMIRIIEIRFVTPANSNDIADNHLNIEFEFYIKATGERAVAQF
tara:strand:+ start:6551 stop:6928 length:378 start_codon:yes stop_codon:yes gene_type:complete